MEAKTDHSLTIHNGKVILAPTNTSDPYQHWIKDEKFGCDVKDEQGYSSFALVNKATDQALKHAIGVKYPVQLTAYNPNALDMSVLWSMSRNPGDGYRAVRAASNIHLNVTAHNSDTHGQEVVFWDWNATDDQRWTIAFCCKFF
ncbi:ricin B-like lectin R40G3 [Bidens hawaiensis]|uniref:ricin B-like lectin R40G3 n=1 Tax=Bidens hawaiensis TaxID=980011 RepID=UPI00404960D6